MNALCVVSSAAFSCCETSMRNCRSSLNVRPSHTSSFTRKLLIPCLRRLKSSLDMSSGVCLIWVSSSFIAVLTWRLKMK